MVYIIVSTFMVKVYIFVRCKNMGCLKYWRKYHPQSYSYDHHPELWATTTTTEVEMPPPLISIGSIPAWSSSSLHTSAHGNRQCTVELWHTANRKSRTTVDVVIIRNGGHGAAAMVNRLYPHRFPLVVIDVGTTHYLDRRATAFEIVGWDKT
jgi:hypothetical protein